METVRRRSVSGGHERCWRGRVGLGSAGQPRRQEEKSRGRIAVPYRCRPSGSRVLNRRGAESGGGSVGHRESTGIFCRGTGAEHAHGITRRSRPRYCGLAPRAASADGPVNALRSGLRFARGRSSDRRSRESHRITGAWGRTQSPAERARASPHELSTGPPRLPVRGHTLYPDRARRGLEPLWVGETSSKSRRRQGSAPGTIHANGTAVASVKPHANDSTGSSSIQNMAQWKNTRTGRSARECGPGSPTALSATPLLRDGTGLPTASHGGSFWPLWSWKAGALGE